MAVFRSPGKKRRWSLAIRPHRSQYSLLCFLLTFWRQSGRRDAREDVPCLGKAVYVKAQRLCLNVCVNTCICQLLKKWVRISHGTRADARNRRSCCKTSGNLLKPRQITLF